MGVSSKLEPSFPPFLPPSLPSYSPSLATNFPGTRLESFWEKESALSKAVGFSAFVIYFFGFPPSFLAKCFLNNLSLVWTPGICPHLGQESQGVPRTLEI